MKEQVFTQNTKIKFTRNNITGTGKVVGMSSYDPLSKGIYIIEPNTPVMSPSYPYTHFTCWGVDMEEAN